MNGGHGSKIGRARDIVFITLGTLGDGVEASIRFGGYDT